MKAATPSPRPVAASETPTASSNERAAAAFAASGTCRSEQPATKSARRRDTPCAPRTPMCTPGHGSMPAAHVRPATATIRKPDEGCQAAKVIVNGSTGRSSVAYCGCRHSRGTEAVRLTFHRGPETPRSSSTRSYMAVCRRCSNAYSAGSTSSRSRRSPSSGGRPPGPGKVTREPHREVEHGPGELVHQYPIGPRHEGPAAPQCPRRPSRRRSPHPCGSRSPAGGRAAEPRSPGPAPPRRRSPLEGPVQDARDHPASDEDEQHEQRERRQERTGHGQAQVDRPFVLQGLDGDLHGEPLR